MFAHPGGLFFTGVVIKSAAFNPPSGWCLKAVLICRPLNRKEVYAEREVLRFLSSSSAAVNSSTLM